MAVAVAVMIASAIEDVHDLRRANAIEDARDRRRANAIEIEIDGSGRQVMATAELAAAAAAALPAGFSVIVMMDLVVLMADLCCRLLRHPRNLLHRLRRLCQWPRSHHLIWKTTDLHTRTRTTRRQKSGV